MLCGYGGHPIKEFALSAIHSREIRLHSRPDGLPTAGNFELAEVLVRPPGPGEMLVRNLYMSVDPYMRGRMVDRRSYAPPFQLGEPLSGGAVGRVVQSHSGRFPVGTYVLSGLGWREHFVSGGEGLSAIDPALAPIQAYLGVMGMPGMTAYVGLTEIAHAKEGETVFVSAAAGAVGAAACQIAANLGCRVVGSAGSDEKVDWLLNVAGVNAAFNYKKTPVAAGLARTCKEGIDVYFENVGGDHLEAALSRMNVFGRVAVCGMISQYNATAATPGPYNIGLLVTKRITMRGFLVGDHGNVRDRFRADMARWIAEGKMKWAETVVDGIEQAPAAFVGLFSGDNLGKMLVRLAHE